MTGAKIAPSILSADFAQLADDVERVAAEADLLHVDVMDGHQLNLTIGPPVVKSLRKRTDLHLDCYLVDNPATSETPPTLRTAARCNELGDRMPFATMRSRPTRRAAQSRDAGPSVAVPEEIDVLLFMSAPARRASPPAGARPLTARLPSTSAQSVDRDPRRHRGGAGAAPPALTSRPERHLPRRRPCCGRPADPGGGMAHDP
jgi:hypothetical protein